jgi:hypothetical protein
MEKQTSFMLGVVLWLLAFVGFFTGKKHLFKLMNVDPIHSVLRIPLGGLLLYGGRSELKMTRDILLGTGLIYLLIGSAGVKDRKVGGLLPSGLTGFDLVYHFATGLAVIWMGARRGRMMKP